MGSGVTVQSGAGGGGAPTGASYVTTATEADLTAEKVLGTDVIMRGLAANKPAASIAGRTYIETDGSKLVWRDNGTTWDEIARGLGDVVPAADNTENVGTASLRFAAVRAVVVSTSDLEFANRWRLVEAESLGLGEGVALVRADGTVAHVFH